MALLGAAPRAVRAPQQDAGGKTVWDGVYTEAQSVRAQEIAKEKCVACHGERLAGGDVGPALSGADFLAAWSGRTLGELYDKIQMTMPADSAGTLKPQQSVDLVAYVLKLNDFPAGGSELATEAAELNQIRIRSRK